MSGGVSFGAVIIGDMVIEQNIHAPDLEDDFLGA